MNQAFILKKPIITEKTLKLASQSVFTFEVAKLASKDQVKDVIQKLFKVEVEEVKTVRIAPKSYSSRNKRVKLLTNASKKALVKLKSGQKIDLFEVEEK